ERRGKVGLFRYLHDTKDSDLVVVFGENSAAVIGLTFAIASLILAKVTDDGRWDALGSLAIGGVLVAVAIFLAREVKALLVGESADPALLQTIEQTAAEDPRIIKVLRTLTVQQGPGEIVMAIKLQFQPDLTTATLVGSINEFEQRLQQRCPEVK